MRLSPEQHLRTQRDFQNVRQAGRRYQCDAFTLWWWAQAGTACARRPAPDELSNADCAPSAAPLRRVGVVASRAAVGNAVQRNRAKRRLRALFRLHQGELPPSGDLLLVARRLLNRLPWSVLEKRFLGICEQLCRALPGASPAPRTATSDA
ncbi:hypothetical protein AXK11_01090 [Cephaloticoccus primus]|uniref:Ribonuclease P protein component n=1 Tax=Cephaloticoccus primus TaxID=1548207 RepID=A0A139SUH5_9BACT|nr:ribonuclease P protein component [Cephaloticoccus primus]KXU38184.1 hypothetical protein AXK11_01090 [Cephaloticoccus primus]